MALWARTAAGTNLAFVKGFGKVLKSWKEIIKHTFIRKPPAKPKVLETEGPPAGEKSFVYQPTLPISRPNERLQTRIFRSMFSRSLNTSLLNTVRSRVAAEMSSTNSGFRTFRRIPILSLIGITMGVDLENLIEGNSEKVMSEMRNMFHDYGWQSEPLALTPEGLADLEISQTSIASGCEGAVYKAKIKRNSGQAEASQGNNSTSSSDEDFDLAVKAVFNYGAESSSSHILRELQREMVPLHPTTCGNFPERSEVGHLPPHPNIVDMPGIFVDDVLVTEEGLRKFPAALPRSLNPDTCYGRNKTLYLVMRRRTTHLGDYLSSHEVSMTTRCHILAQVLEGVAHLGNHGIAHRDLKSNNILVAVPKAGGVPKVELCDFGCCLAEENGRLRVPFPSRDLFVGGNSWLRAPEIATAQPGPHTVLDFSKSDVWAVGAIAYEILGGENPFYPCEEDNNTRKQLSSVTYGMEDLPELPDDVPLPVRKLVKSLLVRDPKKRPSASVAATVMHLVVMETDQSQIKGGDSQCKSKVAMTNKKHLKPQVLRACQERAMFQRVLVQSLSLLCQLTFDPEARDSTRDVESVSKFLFLSRLNYGDFKLALHFF